MVGRLWHQIWLIDSHYNASSRWLINKIRIHVNMRHGVIYDTESKRARLRGSLWWSGCALIIRDWRDLSLSLNLWSSLGGKVNKSNTISFVDKEEGSKWSRKNKSSNYARNTYYSRKPGRPIDGAHNQDVHLRMEHVHPIFIWCSTRPYRLTYRQRPELTSATNEKELHWPEGRAGISSKHQRWCWTTKEKGKISGRGGTTTDLWSCCRNRFCNRMNLGGN